MYQAFEEFNVLNSTLERTGSRRIWTNGHLRVYFSYRWEETGQWVISNGTYSVIRDRTNVTNSDAPVDSPLGPNYLRWDHFSNDNIYQPLRQEITLLTRCNESQYETQPPTLTPPTNYPTNTPSDLGADYATYARFVCNAVCVFWSFFFYSVCLCLSVCLYCVNSLH